MSERIRKTSNEAVPAEYNHWLLYEVLLSPVVTFIAFAILLSFLSSDHSENRGVADAFIAMFGSGDLLILAALLMINVSAKAQKANYADLNPLWMNVTGFLFLMIYLAYHVHFDEQDMSSCATLMYLFCVFSAGILFLSFLLADLVMRSLQIRALEEEIERAAHRSQYN